MAIGRLINKIVNLSKKLYLWIENNKKTPLPGVFLLDILLFKILGLGLVEFGVEVVRFH